MRKSEREVGGAMDRQQGLETLVRPARKGRREWKD